MDNAVLLLILEIFGLVVIAFSLILAAIYISQRLSFVIERRRSIAKSDQRKLEAKLDLDYKVFYEDLYHPTKALPPIRGEVVNPPVVDRCFEEDEEEVYR